MPVTERRPVRSYRLPARTFAQVDEMSKQWQTSATDIIMLAVDRMYREEYGKPEKAEEEKPTA